MADNIKYHMDDFSTMSKDAKKYAQEVIQAIALEGYSRVIKKTPVGEYYGGSARGNWICSLDKSSKHDRIKTDKNGANTINKVAKVIDKFEIGRNLYLTNNLPYIQKLELGQYPTAPKGESRRTINGFSKQAPSGMVRITMLELDDIVKKAKSETDDKK